MDPRFPPDLIILFFFFFIIHFCHHLQLHDITCKKRGKASIVPINDRLIFNFQLDNTFGKDFKNCN